MSKSGGETKPADFEAVKTRLEEIARAIDDDSLSLDEALDLYEEAVKLGLAASDLLETGIEVEDEPAEAPQDAPTETPGVNPGVAPTADAVDAD